MSKIGILFAVLTLTFGTFAQLNTTDAKGRKQGLWVKYYPNSKVPEFQGEFKDGKPQGTFTYYYPNNKPKAILKHENNGARTVAYMYHDNGRLMAQGIYKNQKKDSIWTSFNEFGRLVMRETYKDDVLHGERRLYYIPSDPQDKREVCISIYQYKNGQVEGDFKEIYPTGQVKLTGSFLDHKRHGEWIYYELDGKKMSVERYYKGQKHGWFVGYNKDGSEGLKRYFYYGRELNDKEREINFKSQKANGQNPNVGYR